MVLASFQALPVSWKLTRRVLDVELIQVHTWVSLDDLPNRYRVDRIEYRCHPRGPGVCGGLVTDNQAATL